MIDNNTLTSVPEDLDVSGTIRIDNLSTSAISSPFIIKGDYGLLDTYQNCTLTSAVPASYYSTPLYSSSVYYSSEEILSTIKSIFDSYGFEFVYNPDDVVSSTSLSKKETSSDILGWVAVGFIENKSYLSNFQLWLRFATNNTLDPTAITLIVKEGSYFENFSIKILLENHLVLIDSTSGIVHIIQEMLLGNLQKAFDEIIEGLESETRRQGTTSLGYCNGISGVVSCDAISTQQIVRGQGTTSLDYCNGISVSYDADTTTSVNNYGVINC